MKVSLSWSVINVLLTKIFQVFRGIILTKLGRYKKWVFNCLTLITAKKLENVNKLNNKTVCEKLLLYNNQK